MRRLATLVSGLSGLMLAFAAVRADESPRGPEASGTVKFVDPRAMTLTLETYAGLESFKVGESPSITGRSSGRKLRLSDLKAGEHVRVHYAGSGKERRVSTIELLSEPVTTADGGSPGPARP